jgi:glycine dehydrogenase subunit 1
MPGRIIGRTVDLDGKPGFTLTLQAREQHIRPQQGDLRTSARIRVLLVTAATIHMSLLGSPVWRKSLLRRKRRRVHGPAALTRIKGVKVAFSVPRFHEAVLQLDRKVSDVLDALAKRGHRRRLTTCRDTIPSWATRCSCARPRRDRRRHRAVRQAAGRVLK